MSESFIPRALVAIGLLALLAACATTAPAPTPQTEPVAQDERAPLIDRQLFFGDPEIAGAQISPDGRFITFRKPYRDVMNIWVKGVDEPFDAARPLTADTERPVSGYFWSQDGRYVLYVQDKGGNENFHVWAVDPTAAAEPDTGVPPARDLTPLEDVRAMIYAVPERTPGSIVVGLNDRDPALHDVYRVDLATGERELLVRNDANVAAWVTDLEGDVRLAYRLDADGGTEVLRVEDGRLGEVIYTCTFEETCAPLRFHKDGERVYFLTNKGEDLDLTQLVLLDPDTGATELIHRDPEGEVDFSGPIFSDATEELVGVVYVGDRERIYPLDDGFAGTLERLRAALPDGELGFNATTEDERLWVVSVGRDVDPGSVYLFDATTGQAERLYVSRPDLPSQHLAPMQAVRYTARDGQEIPAYLTLPVGVPAEDLPTIIMPHGGPWARDNWGYNPWAQFLANRGYAVLNPNFRGSVGYGKAFLNAGNLEWGTGVMQHDLSDAVGYLVDEGIADPDRIGIMGGSYGGYATLAGLAFTPELYDAGVSIVGPSNIITLLNSIPPYWGPARRIFDLRVGDPSDPEDRVRLEAQSPFFHATDIVDPLLVIQGANDPRVKQAESDQIVHALHALGRDVGYIVAPDEGHGFAGRENRLAMAAAIERFLAEHLGGRYQEELTPEIRQRLTTLTVDPATVEPPPPADVGRAAATSPLPAADVALVSPGVFTYSSNVRLGTGQEIAVTSRQEIAEATENGRTIWRIVSTAEGPMGSGTDTWVLDAATLRPMSRRIQQGPATVELTYGDREVTGRIQAGPQEMPIAAGLEAPVLGDEAALSTFIASLPLAPEYRTTLRTFEVASQKVRLWSIAVTGREEVTVPAGTFDTFRVAMEPLDGEGGGAVFWVRAETPRMVVKTEAQLPPMMGGGTATSVLESLGG